MWRHFDFATLKGNRRLHESCEWSEQCTGSTGANECKYKDGVNICACPEGKDVFKGICLKSKDDQTNLFFNGTQVLEGFEEI